jgi:hypothetical protein
MSCGKIQQAEFPVAVVCSVVTGLDFRTTDHVTRFARGNLRTRSYIDGIAP